MAKSAECTSSSLVLSIIFYWNCLRFETPHHVLTALRATHMLMICLKNFRS